MIESVRNVPEFRGMLVLALPMQAGANTESEINDASEKNCESSDLPSREDATNSSPTRANVMADGVTILRVNLPSWDASLSVSIPSTGPNSH